MHPRWWRPQEPQPLPGQSSHPWEQARTVYFLAMVDAYELSCVDAAKASAGALFGSGVAGVYLAMAASRMGVGCVKEA